MILNIASLDCTKEDYKFSCRSDDLEAHCNLVTKSFLRAIAAIREDRRRMRMRGVPARKQCEQGDE